MAKGGSIKEATEHHSSSVGLSMGGDEEEN